MIAAVVLGLTLISSEDGLSGPQLLEPKAACLLVKSGSIRYDVMYSISGTYFSDGMHGSTLDISGCDESIMPIIDGEAAANISNYHRAFDEKCGGHLMNDYISGAFTGKFVKRKAQLFGMKSPAMIDFFIISNIEAKGLDPASITCPK
jgi:hypothetical protein